MKLAPANRCNDLLDDRSGPAESNRQKGSDIGREAVAAFYQSRNDGRQFSRGSFGVLRVRSFNFAQLSSDFTSLCEGLPVALKAKFVGRDHYVFHRLPNVAPTGFGTVMADDITPRQPHLKSIAITYEPIPPPVDVRRKVAENEAGYERDVVFALGFDGSEELECHALRLATAFSYINAGGAI